MKKILIIISISLFTTGAMALESGEFVFKAAVSSEHPCVKVNLSSEQISAIRDIVFKNGQRRAQDEANVRKAMLDVEYALTSSTSTKEDGEKAQNSLQQALSSLTKTVAELDLSINYDVLRADQRQLGSLCSKYMYSFPSAASQMVTAQMDQSK